jgi:Cu/Ag efflux protein CusF
MKYLVPARTVAAALLLTCALPALPHAAAAQTNPTLTNVIPESAAVTLRAKITAIDTGTRAVTLAGASGSAVTLTAGPLVRLDLLKVGDRVNAKYYRSIGFVVNPPADGNGVPVSDDEIAQITAQQAQVPGGVGVRLTRVSGTVVGIDLAAHSVDLVNPSGGAIYTVDVTDPARVALLSTLKLGDTVTAVISQALAVSIEPAPTSWF